MNTFELLHLSIPVMAVAMLASGPAKAYSSDPVPSPIAHDLASRSKDIHWPKAYRPQTAMIFAHNEIAIGASCQKVWTHLIAATAWPQWYPNATDVRVLDDAR